MAQVQKEAAEVAATMKARVARGRTVMIDGKSHSEGAEVTLPEGEARRLHGCGFLRFDGEAETRPPTSSVQQVGG